MNYTEKYHLPQWEKTDRIMMADFNRMCADMEAGLSKTAREASEETAAAKQENAAAAARAQSTANSAVSKANAAQAAADAAYSPSKMPYTIGTYTGTGGIGVEQYVNIGFTPRFVMVTGTLSGGFSMQAMGGEGIPAQPVILVENGFRVATYRGWPEVNEENTTFVYIAFP